MDHMHEHAEGDRQMKPSGLADGAVRDPVCGMTVDPATAKHRHDLGDTIYYFCSEGCRSKFAAHPERYLNPPATKPAITSPAMGIRVHMTVDQRRETTIIFRRHPPRPLRLNQYGLKHAGVHIHQRRLQEVSPAFVPKP